MGIDEETGLHSIQAMYSLSNHPSSADAFRILAPSSTFNALSSHLSGAHPGAVPGNNLTLERVCWVQ